MEIKDFIKIGLDRCLQSTKRAVDGLSHYELVWRPGPEANPIGLILLHQAHTEDNFVQARIQGKTLVWESEKWYEKLGLAITDTGSGFTAEQVAAFHVPELKDLLGYGEAVRNRTLQYLGEITSDKLDQKVTSGRMGEVAISTIFAIIITHGAQHAGEITYLRGLQRGMNK